MDIKSETTVGKAEPIYTIDGEEVGEIFMISELFEDKVDPAIRQTALVEGTIDEYDWETEIRRTV